MTKKTIRRSTVKKELSEDAKKAKMEQWAVRLGLPKNTAQKMLDKYGPYAYQMMEKAIVEPMNIKPIVNGKFRSSAGCVRYFVNNTLSDEQISKITGTSVSEIAVNRPDQTASASTSSPAEEQADEAAARMDMRIDASKTDANTPTPEIQSTAAERYQNIRKWAPAYLMQYEDMKTDAYMDSGTPSIGLGTKQHRGPKGQWIPTEMGDKVTPDQAIQYCQENVDLCWDYLKKSGVHVEKMTEQETMAILSYMYNCGSGYIVNKNLNGPAKVAAINAYLDDRNNVAKRNKVRDLLSKPSNGKRRDAEIAMLLGDISERDWNNTPWPSLNHLNYSYNRNTGHYTADLDLAIVNYNGPTARDSIYVRGGQVSPYHQPSPDYNKARGQYAQGRSRTRRG